LKNRLTLNSGGFSAIIVMWEKKEMLAPKHFFGG